APRPAALQFAPYRVVADAASPTGFSDLYKESRVSSLTLDRLLQLAGDFVGRGVHRTLHDLDGARNRLVEALLDCRFANHDQPCFVGSELLSRFLEFLATQCSEP